MPKLTTIIYNLGGGQHQYAVLNQIRTCKGVVESGVGAMALPEETWLSDFT